MLLSSMYYVSFGLQPFNIKTEIGELSINNMKKDRQKTQGLPKQQCIVFSL
jgi:hypothetical protein